MFFIDCVKVIEYLASAVIVVLFNPFVKPSPKTKMFLFQLSICIDELMSALNIIKFLPELPSNQ